MIKISKLELLIAKMEALASRMEVNISYLELIFSSPLSLLFQIRIF